MTKPQDFTPFEDWMMRVHGLWGRGELTPHTIAEFERHLEKVPMPDLRYMLDLMAAGRRGKEGMPAPFDFMEIREEYWFDMPSEIDKREATNKLPAAEGADRVTPHDEALKRLDEIKQKLAKAKNMGGKRYGRK